MSRSEPINFTTMMVVHELRAAPDGNMVVVDVRPIRYEKAAFDSDGKAKEYSSLLTYIVKQENQPKIGSMVEVEISVTHFT